MNLKLYKKIMSWSHNNGTISFNTGSKMDDYDIPTKKMRPSRDPMSHRIIEKRRRDRMNQCLADLSQLIPPAYLKQGQGRIEKTEIIEMACKYIKQLKQQLREKDTAPENSFGGKSADRGSHALPYSDGSCCQEKFYLGFTECMDDVMRFLVEKKSYNPSDNICTELLDDLKEGMKKFRPQLIPMASGEGHTEEMSSSMQGIMSENLGNVPSTSGSPASEMTSTRDYHLQQSRDLNGHNTASNNIPSNMSVDDTINSDPGYSTGSVLQDPMDSDLAQDDETSSHSMTELQEMELAGKQGLAGAYKFKNTIKQRFSADARTPEKGSRHYAPGDSSSASSSEDTKRKDKSQSHSPSSDSASTNYPASDYSSNGNGSSSSLSSNCHGPNARKQASPEHDNGAASLNSAVPGFALHPSGTYYIPIVIAVAHLLPYLRNEPASNSVSICHPISIPISFGSPFVSMQNIHIGSGQDPGGHAGVVTKSEPGFSSTTYRR